MKTLQEYIQEALQMCIREGFDIDEENKVISFNPFHQDNVDTNDYINPYIILNDVENGEIILSLFERKDNDSTRGDGNPIVYALKNIKGWRLNNPKSDILALMKRVISITKHLNVHFDTLITTPSNNNLNKQMFNVAKKLLDYDEFLEDDFLEKIPLDEIFEGDDFTDIVNLYCKENSIDDVDKFHKKLNSWFHKMKIENNETFSYKYIPVVHRNIVKQSIRVAVKWLDDCFDNASELINGKDVLVLDDTVASGKTLSDTAEAIRTTFAPKSITFLTLFSPKSSEKFSNVKLKL